uniref:Uncharacterized protein n=1 Tax=Molossus molossus TaxID=27622 RepID=A0A7J8FRW7_MOLMO|nr:hypothetical protein HJG59_008371 [Molossus molossus]
MELGRTCPRSSPWHSGQGLCVLPFPVPRLSSKPRGPRDPQLAEHSQLVSSARPGPKPVNTWGDRLPLERPFVCPALRGLQCKGRLSPTCLFPGITNLVIVKREQASICNEQVASWDRSGYNEDGRGSDSRTSTGAKLMSSQPGSTK